MTLPMTLPMTLLMTQPAALLTILLALSPLILLTGAIALFNFTTFRAGLATLVLLAVILLAAAQLDPAVWGMPAAEPLTVWPRALPDTLILTLTVVYTLFFGLLLYHLMEGSGALATLLQGVALLGRDGVERLIWVLLVFGPLFESISGFGLAIVVVIPMLRGLGYSPLQTMALSLVSQLAVPWGALAIGMSLGAVMTGMALDLTGTATAVVAAPGYVAFWVMALMLARPPGGLLPWGVLRSGAALLVFSCGVWAANRWISPELGGVVGAAALAAWLVLSGGGVQRGGAARLPPLAALGWAAAPYAVLLLLLVGSRYWEAARSWLTGNLLLRFPGGAFELPLLYNPGASLALACGVTWLLFRGKKLDSGASLTTMAWAAAAWTATAQQLWVAGRAVFVLILVARVMFEAGMTEALAEGAAALPGALAVVAVPLIAGLGGFLTGSVAAANALFINFQVDVAARLALPTLWVVAVQNALSAAFTAFSPARLVFAATMTGQPDKEGEVLRRMAPLAAVLVLIGALALSPWGLALLQALRPWLVAG